MTDQLTDEAVKALLDGAAPERLWLWPAEPEGGVDKFVSFPDQPYPSGSTEYIRAEKAEAELAAAQQREAGLRGALSYLRTQAKNGTLHPQVVIQNADASLAAWPEVGE